MNKDYNEEELRKVLKVREINIHIEGKIDNKFSYNCVKVSDKGLTCQCDEFVYRKGDFQCCHIQWIKIFLDRNPTYKPQPQ